MSAQQMCAGAVQAAVWQLVAVWPWCNLCVCCLETWLWEDGKDAERETLAEL